MKKLLTALALFLLTCVALAADLDQMKKDGLVGERADGYLGMVEASVPADVVSLVADVNGKRKAEYQRIAASNNLSLAQVQALAGKKAIEKTLAGNWVLLNGGWERK
ncbi:MAG: YdbL family protein [Proteobacteria bacterium]|nr:YdbL family protein [Pseudomonadota bacterium]